MRWSGGGPSVRRMRTDNLAVNQLSTGAYGWYLDYLRALDAKDLDAYGAFLADDVSLQMNNEEPTVGKQAVLAALGAYWPTFGTLEHDLLRIYGTDESFCLEAVNHYTRADGAPVTLRAVAFTDRDADGRAGSVRFYTDTGPLYA